MHVVILSQSYYIDATSNIKSFSQKNLEKNYEVQRVPNASHSIYMIAANHWPFWTFNLIYQKGEGNHKKKNSALRRRLEWLECLFVEHPWPCPRAVVRGTTLNWCDQLSSYAHEQHTGTTQIHATRNIVISVTNSICLCSISIVNCPCSVTDTKCKLNIICHSL